MVLTSLRAMPTPDGISTEDWDVVHGLAVDIVNATDEERPDLQRRLLEWLEKLEAKYGSLPSILATRADNLDIDDPAREELLVRAHAAAESIGDRLNLLETAHSLAELFLERKIPSEANRWLERMRERLGEDGGSDLAEEYGRLREAYRRLVIRLADKSAG